MLENQSETQIVQSYQDTPSNVEVVSQNYLSGVRMRNNIEPDSMYETFPEQASVPSNMLMDYTRILNKPFKVGNVKWGDGSAKNTYLITQNFPEMILNNPLASIPFNASTLYRAKASLILQVSGTPMHQGTLMVSAVPVGFGVNTTPSITGTGPMMQNTLMAAPHVFLSANESTPATLEIPFYPNTKLAKCDTDLTTVDPNFFLRDYANIVFYVVNPLIAPTGGSTTLTISMHVVFKYIEFYAPHVDTTYQAEGLVDMAKKFGTKAIDRTFSTARDVTGDFFDTARSLVKAYTGLHNPNEPELKSKIQVTTRQLPNVVDKPTQFEKLDPFYDFDRITTQPIFDTNRDEMSIREILRKPQYLGTFTVSSDDGEGKTLWSRPITPQQEFRPINYTDVNGNVAQTFYFTNLQQSLCTMAKYWKGTIKIHIQSNMSNFHFCKLLVARDYSVRSLALTTTFVAPDYNDVSNLPCETLEFAAGGQVQTIEMPFISAMDQLPLTNSGLLNASEHGIYYIYLNQPLVTNGSVSPKIQFNVYISCGDDFELMGYATDPYRILYPGVIGTIPALDEKDLINFKDQSFVNPLVDLKAQGSVNPINVSSQQNINFIKAKEEKDHESSDFRPITSVRDITRRMYKVARYKFSNNDVNARRGLFLFSVASLVGVQEQINEVANPGPDPSKSVAASALRRAVSMFHGLQGGVKAKIVVQGTSGASAWYVPPSYGYRVEPSVLDATWAARLPNVSAASTGTQIAVNSALYQNLKFTSNTLDEEFSCQSVLQERPNYFATGYAGIIDPTQAGLASESISVLDLELPNMSPYRFVGDCTGHLHVQTGPIYDSPTTNMGHIVLFLPQNITTGATITESGVYISIFAGLNDSARLGYQVYAPFIIQPAIESQTPGLYQPVSTSNSGNGAPMEKVVPQDRKSVV